MARQWSAVLGGGPMGGPHGGPALHPLPPLPAGYSLGYYPQAFYAQGALPGVLVIDPHVIAAVAGGLPNMLLYRHLNFLMHSKLQEHSSAP